MRKKLKAVARWFAESAVRIVSMDCKKKVQAILAVSLTIVFFAALPVFAWFSHQKEMTLATRVNSPSSLYINAAHRESISYFDLSDINAEDTAALTYTDNGATYAYQDFVFCVCGDKVSYYDLQLSHTSNIPFAYTLYHATENGTIEAKIDNQVYTYTLGEKVDFDYENLNEDGRTANDDQKWTRNYTNGADDVQVYANPVYHVKRRISTGSPDGGFTDYYVLRISWIQQKNLTELQREERLDIVQNNKETDMIYITAGVS